MNIYNLGRSSWGFLHTLSFAYPIKPSKKDKKTFGNFMELFSKIYPCKTCQKHFEKDFKENPPKLDSRKDFTIWMCEMHNKVKVKKTNQFLGKPEFSCNYEDLQKRWLYNPEC